MSLPGYSVVLRHDRNEHGGGVAIFARKDIRGSVCELEKSNVAERGWVIIHTDVGAFLIGSFYRPPNKGEISTILSLGVECAKHNTEVIGTFILGDLNVHARRWLRYSSGESAEGEALHDFACRFGLKQLVKEPTREDPDNLLDVALTDVERTTCTVLPRIADHKLIWIRSDIAERVCAVRFDRAVWIYALANWDRMRRVLGSIKWSIIDTVPVECMSSDGNTLFNSLCVSTGW